MGHVLIIDNDELMRPVIASQLNAAGITTQEANDGQQGLDMAKQHHPSVIILDEHMPKMNGQQFVVELQKEDWFKEVKIIVFTALHDADLVNHKMIAGVTDYMYKGTATPEQVVATVKRYMEPQT
jgi:CheY-like chemotaxis protein